MTYSAPFEVLQGTPKYLIKIKAVHTQVSVKAFLWKGVDKLKKVRKYQIIMNWRKMYKTIETVEKINTVLLQRKPQLV